MITNHLTVLPKKPQTLMFITGHLENTTTKSHLVISLFVFIFLNSLTFLLSLSLVCMCSGGVVTVCVYLGDRLGLICTTAVEGKGWHVTIVIWHCAHWD